MTEPGLRTVPGSAGMRSAGWALTLRRPRKSWDSTCGMDGSLPCRISCHLSPLVGRGSAPDALITVSARAKTSAFVRLL